MTSEHMFWLPVLRRYFGVVVAGCLLWEFARWPQERYIEVATLTIAAAIICTGLSLLVQWIAIPLGAFWRVQRCP